MTALRKTYTVVLFAGDGSCEKARKVKAPDF